MADCAAMYVDVVTYLFNFLAERLKGSHENMTARQVRLRKLLFELVPPLISVATLVVVTIIALRQAWQTLMAPSAHGSIPNVQIMLIFSALNLLLDCFNVSCFARVDSTLGISSLQVDNTRTETSPLLPSLHETKPKMNLNMCSAWTHVFADTLRSIAVLIAAGMAYAFPDSMSPVQADSWGAVVVSVIILASLSPLIQGLYATARKIRCVWTEPCDGTTRLLMV
jgi:Co/Zn/Cd efflux system component